MIPNYILARTASALHCMRARQILVLPFLIASCTRIRHDRVPLECCIFTAIQPICTLDGQEGQRSKKTLT